MHHVCICSETVRRAIGVFWLRQRSLWWGRRGALDPFRVMSSFLSDLPMMLMIISDNVDPPFPVYGGLFQHEAIMLLRRFYIQENENGLLIELGYFSLTRNAC